MYIKIFSHGSVACEFGTIFFGADANGNTLAEQKEFEKEDNYQELFISHLEIIFSWIAINYFILCKLGRKYIIQINVEFFMDLLGDYGN